MHWAIYPLTLLLAAATRSNYPGLITAIATDPPLHRFPAAVT